MPSKFPIQQPPDTKEAPAAAAALAAATASPSPETPSRIQKEVREEITNKYKTLDISKKLDNFYTHMKAHLTAAATTMLLSGGGMLKTFRITHSKSKKNTTKNTNNIIKKVYNNPRVYSKYNKLKHKTKKNKHVKHINKSVKRTHTILMH